jgi:threonine synthase
VIPEAPALRCTGCGLVHTDEEGPPFRCRAAGAGDGVDHLLGREGPPAGVEFPFGDTEPNPFVRYRRFLHCWKLWHARGLADAQFVGLVRKLDDRVAEVDGRGFEVTPFTKASGLGPALGLESGLWVKDETRNVAGSHKARHLFGLAVYLEVAERVGVPGAERSRPLAIASCGNAALAAAVVARAARRPLRVFIPPSANPEVVRRLEALGAERVVCPRQQGAVPGDPTLLAFREAVAQGALPFCAQGTENGLTIDGGMTLAFELVSQLRAPLDRLAIQVGGGALGSACVQGLRWAHALGALPRLPRFHFVQTAAVPPLARAWRRVAERLGGAAVEGLPDAALAAHLADHATAEQLEGAMAEAARHRAGYMWPIDGAPDSLASGLLDDETYDWRELVRGMLQTGGYPLLASEPALGRARALGQQQTAIPVDATGSAGLAGLLELAFSSPLPAGEQVAVLFTGVQR